VKHPFLQVKDFLTNALTAIVEKGFELSYFTEKPPTPLDNNIAARTAAHLDGPGDALLTRCEEICSGDRTNVHQGPISLTRGKKESIR
jgi:hypothetical protein